MERTPHPEERRGDRPSSHKVWLGAPESRTTAVLRSADDRFHSGRTRNLLVHPRSSDASFRPQDVGWRRGVKAEIMDATQHSNIVSFIWGIADDVLRDLYVRGKDELSGDDEPLEDPEEELAEDAEDATDEGDE